MTLAPNICCHSISWNPVLLPSHHLSKIPGCLQVLGGADLFLQGIIVPQEGLGSFSVGDLRVIKIPDNPYPFAVGLLEVCPLCSQQLFAYHPLA